MLIKQQERNYNSKNRRSLKTVKELFKDPKVISKSPKVTGNYLKDGKFITEEVSN